MSILIEDAGWLDNEQGDSLHTGLRWNAEDGSYESWAVGIAPYETMPFTRQFSGAPFIALVVRPLPPADARPDTPQGVHFAERLQEILPPQG
jgi:hypothetical protein